jgi:phosphate-selective porin OprO/OprP
MIIILVLVILCLLPELSTGQTTSANPETILIRNVILMDSDDSTKDVMVNLLIEDSRLDLVTRDSISIDELNLALDAGGGVLLGKLAIGEPASFLILDQDPRKSIESLLNTKSHLRLAMQDGRIVKNNLPILQSDKEKKKENRGWLAYSPPPMTLPLSYADETRWNRWEGNWISGIFTAALALDRTPWLRQDDASKQQVGDLNDFDGGEIRAFRFCIGGTINFRQPWIYVLAGATNAFDSGFDTEQISDITLFDYRLDIPLPAGITMSVGKQKAPISMERLMPLVFTPMHERSVATDGMLSARDVGVLFNGTLFKLRMTWAGGVFNDWFDAGEQFNDRATQVIGRLTTVIFVAEKESNLLHFGIGGRFSNAKQGIRYARKPEFNLSPIYVDTDQLEAENAVTWVGEFAWRRGPAWLESEYVGSSLDSPSLENPYFWGYHVSANWAISGEMRSYNHKAGRFNQLPVARSVYENGPGAWEANLRWSEIDLNDKSVQGGHMKIASIGFTWWLTPVFSFSMNYRYIWLDHAGYTGRSSGLNSRVFLSLE